MDVASSSEYPETADIETSSAGYAARFAGPTGEWLLRKQERIVVQLLKRAGVRTVLDVGGGHGQLAHPLAREGFEVTVLGSAPVCAVRIQDLIDQQRCRFVTGNVIALPFPDRSFDAVLSVRLLPHCEQWSKLIRELARVARQLVVVDYPHASGLNALAPWLFEAKKKMEKNTRTWRNFSHREVVDAFASAGCNPVSRRGQFFWPMVLHRAIKSPTLSTALEWLPAALGLTARLGTPVLAAFHTDTRAR